jgi:hypothetical protein
LACTTCPTITALSPNATVAGSPDVTIHITGTNFLPQGDFIRTFVVWPSNVWLRTQVVSTTELTAVIPASLLHDPTEAKIRVSNADTMDGIGATPGKRSNVVTFSVRSPNN